MAGEEQYINPIIQSMMGLRQKQQNQAQLALEAQRIKQEGQHQQAQIAELTRQHDLEHELHQKQIDTITAHLSAERQRQEFEQKKTLLEAVRSGAGPQLLQFLGAKINQPTAGSNVTEPPPGMPTGVSATTEPTLSFQGNEVPVSAIQNAPQEEANRIRALASAKAGGEAEGALPSRLAEEAFREGNQEKLANLGYTHQSLLQGARQSWETEENRKKLENQLKVAGLERGTQMAIANLTNATHLKVAGFGLTPEETNTNVKPLIVGLATGQIKPNTTNPMNRIAYETMTNAGWHPLEEKEAEELKNLNGLNAVFDKLNNFADKHLSNTKGGAMATGAGVKVANAIGLPTETQSDFDNVKSQALVIGRALEGLSGGRVLSKQLELDLNALTSPGITKDMAKSKVQNLKDLYVNKEFNTIKTGMPKEQQSLIDKTYGLTTPNSSLNQPDWLRLAPKTNKVGHVLDPQMSISIGHPVYSEK